VRDNHLGPNALPGINGPESLENVPRRKLAKILRGIFQAEAYYPSMNNHDPKLRDLLRQWQDIEPRGDFESNVWRKIRQAEAAEPRAAGWRQWWQALVLRPAFSLAIAVLVAVAIGGVSGWSASRSAAPSPAPLFSFLGNDSLAGGYVHTTTHGDDQP